MDPAGSRLKCYHRESAAVNLHRNNKLSRDEPRPTSPRVPGQPSSSSSFLFPPRALLYFPLSLSLFSSPAPSSLSLPPFLSFVSEREQPVYFSVRCARSREIATAEASLLISNCRGRGFAHPRAFSLFFPVNGEERASVGSRFRLNPPPPDAHPDPFSRPPRFVPFALGSVSATAE